MIVLVCGSRSWPDYSAVHRRLSALPYEDEPVTILHGAAPGADTHADTAARSLGYMYVRRFSADWEKYGKRAGLVRNIEMLDERPDLVLAFQVNGSRGTQHTINEARRRGIPVEVHTA